MVLVTSLVAVLVPFGLGRYLNFVIWMVGLTSLYHLDYHEAAMLTFTIWVLNFLVSMVVLTALMAMFAS